MLQMLAHIHDSAGTVTVTTVALFHFLIVTPVRMWRRLGGGDIVVAAATAAATQIGVFR